MKYFYLFWVFFLCSFSHASVSSWIDMTIENGHIKFPVAIHGHSAMANLDSGAQINAINQNFIDFNKLDVVTGKKVMIRGIYGKEKRNTYDKLTVNMFGTSLIFDNLVSSQLGSSDNALLLGAGFMNKFIIQIDYVNQKLRFLSRKSIDLT